MYLREELELALIEAAADLDAQLPAFVGGVAGIANAVRAR